MEIGLILALLSAVCFAGSSIFLRKGTVQAGESTTAVIITVFLGAFFFLFILLFTAQWDKLWSLSWQGFAVLAIAGIIHYIGGRSLFYSSIRLIGANKSSILARTSAFYAVIVGVLFLKESLTTLLVLGVLCIVAGAILPILEKQSASVPHQRETSKTQTRGILSGLGAAFFWGISGALVKPVIEEIGSPVAAAFVTYTVAALLLAGLLFRKEQRVQLTQLRRASLIPILTSGTFVATAQLLRYTALSYSPVSLVSPLISTGALFIFIFSFLLNRNIEVFTWKVFAGMAAMIIGAFLLFL